MARARADCSLGAHRERLGAPASGRSGATSERQHSHLAGRRWRAQPREEAADTEGKGDRRASRRKQSDTADDGRDIFIDSHQRLLPACRSGEQRAPDESRRERRQVRLALEAYLAAECARKLTVRRMQHKGSPGGLVGRPMRLILLICLLALAIARQPPVREVCALADWSQVERANNGNSDAPAARDADLDVDLDRQQQHRRRQLYHQQRQQQQQQQQQQQLPQSSPRTRRKLEGSGAPDLCVGQSAAWTLLRATYPSLAAHLAGRSFPQADRSPARQQSARQLARLLAEADRLARTADEHEQRPSNWLARVSSAPNFARLVQHFQRQHQSQKAPAPPPADDQYAYGRVAHYPHELATGGAGSLGRTLDKLHELAGLERADRLDELESNRIPLVGAANSADWQERPPALDAARDPTYGRLVLAPNQLEGQRERPGSSLALLRQLGNQMEATRADARSEQPANPESLYGRLVFSPSGGQQASDTSASTLRRLRQQQLELKQLAQADNPNASDRRQSAASREPQTGSTNASQPADSTAAPEFEGVWQSAPQQRVEVRHLRPDGGQAGGARTTAKPGEVFVVD